MPVINKYCLALLLMVIGFAALLADKLFASLVVGLWDGGVWLMVEGG